MAQAKEENRSSKPALGKYLKNIQHHWEPVAHICNPSYSGGRDQEDLSLKTAQANSL
jgi:hypothetical protein